MTEHWTPEEWRHFQATGHMPRRNHEQPPEREVVEVTTGRMHRKMVKRPDVGVCFASLTEERRFDWLVVQDEVIYVDVHPVLSLPFGLRYHADFLVHWVEHPDKPPGYVHRRIEDVKSKRSMTTDFKRLKKIVDSSHPFGPLVVVQYIDGQWVETR